MPLPRNRQTLLLAGIFLILLLFTLNYAGAILLPIIFAFILYLVLQPAMREATKVGVPRTISALLVIVVLFGALSALGISVAGPAASWIAKAPDSISNFESRLFAIKQPLDQLQGATSEVEKLANGDNADIPKVAVTGPGLGSFLWSGTRSTVTGLGTMIVLLFFLLVSGDLMLRRFVEILPTLSDKKQAVEIAHEIERNISGYLATISLMNLAVGVATALAARLVGLSDPILWGALAFMLNFIPILGPLCVTAILFLAGLLTFGSIWHSVLPAGIYLLIHVAGAPLRAQPCARDCLPGVLVLDVGRARRLNRRAHARHRQDHLRPGAALDGLRSLPRRRGQKAEAHRPTLLMDRRPSSAKLAPSRQEESRHGQRSIAKRPRKKEAEAEQEKACRGAINILAAPEQEAGRPLKPRPAPASGGPVSTPG